MTMPGTPVTCSPSCGESQLGALDVVDAQRAGLGAASSASAARCSPRRASGSAPLKSAELSSLSAPAFRCAEAVLDAPAAGAVSRMAAVP